MAEPAERITFGAALADALRRQGWSQRALADALGLSQGAISRWRSGSTEPLAHTVFAIEACVGLQPGELGRHLGYVPMDAVAAGPSVEDAIASDSLLSPQHQRVLRATYRELIRPEG